jgi:Ras of Complex, Roc, domain of DAPkinase
VGMNSLEAKVVILGAQGAGKTSLVVRFVENNFHRNEQSTIGASFLVKKVYYLPCPRKSLSRPVLTGIDKLMIALCGYRFGILPDRNGFGRWYVPLCVGVVDVRRRCITAGRMRR